MSLPLTLSFNQIETLLSLAQLPNNDTEQLLIINEINWSGYETLLQQLGEKSSFKLTYLDGNLEIMSPSRRHESYKKLLGMLLEAYLFEVGIRFYPLGSTTFRSQALSRGIEPDQCYCFNTNKSIPDLAIEVVITSGGIDSLMIYQGLQVPEVWFWEQEKLSVYYLQKHEYLKDSSSHLLPDLDLGLLASYVTSPEPFDAVREFLIKVRNA